MKATSVQIKPHHFIDVLIDLGDEKTHYQPHPYGHALHTVAAALLSNPQTPLELVLGADDICAPCTHNVAGACDDSIDTSFRPDAPASKEQWNQRLDSRWFERLGLKPGDKLTAREYCLTVSEKMGEIADIYRELPPEQIQTRQTNLRKGLARYLA